jgi:hypothetical protein
MNILDSITPDADGCWLWTRGGKTKYPQIRLTREIDGKTWNREEYVHRLSYEQNRGPIPSGMTVHHLCSNTRCVRPDHLELLSSADNVRRRYSPTHCANGHPWDEANTYWWRPPNGTPVRLCRACNRLRWRQRHPRKRPI